MYQLHKRKENTIYYRHVLVRVNQGTTQTTEAGKAVATSEDFNAD